MLRCTLLATIAFAALGTARHATGEDVLFEDNFDRRLDRPSGRPSGWRKTTTESATADWRFVFSLEDVPVTRRCVLVLLPFKTSESVIASVEVTPLDQFTSPDESAGLFLTDADSREFGAEKRNLDGELAHRLSW